MPRSVVRALTSFMRIEFPFRVRNKLRICTRKATSESINYSAMWISTVLTVLLDEYSGSLEWNQLLVTVSMCFPM
jgi:hypothetical protein